MKAQLEILALVLGVLGLAGAAVITGLPNWNVTVQIGPDLTIEEKLLEGLWMNCNQQANFRIQCKVYDSMLILPVNLEAARGFMCASIILSLLAVLVSGCGMWSFKCCQEDPLNKNITLLLGGCLFLLSSLVTLIPICWAAYTITQDFYNPLQADYQKGELGEALYAGWATAGLLLVAGIILIWRFCSYKQDKKYGYGYAMSQVSSNIKLSQTHSKSEDV